VTPILLDSSVLFPNVLRDTLLTLAEHELFEPQWSAAIRPANPERALLLTVDVVRRCFPGLANQGILASGELGPQIPERGAAVCPFTR
jgi:hypothetical protein